MKSMKVNIKYVYSIFLIICLNACIKEENLNLHYNGFAPKFNNDGWEISTPESENMDPVVIDQLYREFYNDEKYPTIRSLLIVRNDKLVAEAYCKDESDINRLHNTMSVTKSITSILIGIAIDKGLIDTIEAPIYQYLAPYFDNNQEKKAISISDVIKMETGLDFDNNLHTSDLISGKGSSLDYVLHKDLIFTPGTEWNYGDGNPQLLSGIIKQVSGKSEAAFAEQYLFEPLGVADYFWESHSDGLNFGALGLWLCPRDMAKIGVLMANYGWWKGIRVVSEQWVKDSGKRQSEYQNYGYYWYPIEDKAFYAEGQGGQLIWIYPEKDLVVVITSDSYSKSWNLSLGYEELFNYVLSSLND